MNCKQCNEEFIPKNKQHLYCTKSCRSKAERERDRVKISQRQKRYKALHKDRLHEYSYQYYKDNWAKSTLRSIKRRCKLKGYDFDLEEDDLTVPDVCPFLGISIVQGSEYKYNSPSVDRIDNSKGYTKDNIQIMSFAANCMKLDMPLEVWQNIHKKWRG